MKPTTALFAALVLLAVSIAVMLMVMSQNDHLEDGMTKLKERNKALRDQVVELDMEIAHRDYRLDSLRIEYEQLLAADSGLMMVDTVLIHYHTTRRNALLTAGADSIHAVILRQITRR